MNHADTTPEAASGTAAGIPDFRCKSRQFLPFVFSALALFVLCSGCLDAPEKFPIALIVPLQGELTDVGTISLKAAELAVSQAKAAGVPAKGSKRFEPELLVISNGDTVEQSVNAVREAIYKQGATVVVGGMLSRNAIPMAVVAEEAGIPFISPGPTHPATTRGKRHVFRIPFTDPVQGDILAHFARNDLKAERAAMFYNRADEYSRGLASNFKKAFTALNGTLAAEAHFVSAQEDFVGQAKMIAEAEPDVLFLPNYHNKLKEQVRQIRAAGVNATLLGGDSWEMLPVESLGGFENAFFSTTWSLDVDSEASRRFIKAYRDRYHEDPNPTAAVVYDALGVLFAAVESVGAIDPESIRKGLANLKRYQGVTGLICFNKSGDPDTRALILGISGGGLRPVKMISVECGGNPDGSP